MQRTHAAHIAQARGVPVIGIAGSLGRNAEVVHGHGIDAIFSVLSRPCQIADAVAEAEAEAEHNVRSSARNVAAVLAIGQRSVQVQRH